MILSIALAWLTILGICWLGWQFLRQNGRLLLCLEELEKRLNELEFGEREEPAGLPVGSEAPAFELSGLGGETRTLAQFRGQALFLIFFNPECGFCRELAPKLADFSEGSTGHWPVPPGDPPGGIASAHPNMTDSVQQPCPAVIPFGESPNGAGESPALPFILILTTGDAEKNREFFAEHKIRCPILLQRESEVATAYQANGTPSGYLIDLEGKIASELTVGTDALLALAAEPRSSRREEALTQKSEIRNPKSEIDESLVTSAATNRFGNRSLARSKIKRDGLKAGTPAPDFRLPRLDGRGELSLQEFRGRRVLLVFSSPHCGPCDTLAPELEKFHRENEGRARHSVRAESPTAESGAQRTDAPYPIAVVMISKGEPKENRSKVKKHGLTFPIVLQLQWEISRRYAMFATPVAYLIDEAGVIAADVAVGVEPIRALLSDATSPPQEREPTMH